MCAHLSLHLRAAALAQAFSQLRKGFPPKVDASYLQRFNLAPANESYVISILRFLGLLDEDGNRIEDRTHFFYGNDESFQSGLQSALRTAYSQLFDEMGDEAIATERGNLAHWFRAADKTTELVGQRQASTFQTLVALAGHGELPTARGNGTKKTASATVAAPKKTTAKKLPTKAVDATLPGQDTGVGRRDDSRGRSGQDMGLTVRIEVNLPAGGDANTYDSIFASIKKHLMS